MFKGFFYIEAVYLLIFLNGSLAQADAVEHARENLNQAYTKAYKKLETYKGKRPEEARRVFNETVAPAKSDLKKAVREESGQSSDQAPSHSPSSTDSKSEPVALDGSHVVPEISFKNSGSNNDTNANTPSSGGSGSDEISFSGSNGSH